LAGNTSENCQNFVILLQSVSQNGMFRDTDLYKWSRLPNASGIWRNYCNTIKYWCALEVWRWYLRLASFCCMSSNLPLSVLFIKFGTGFYLFFPNCISSPLFITYPQLILILSFLG
jgi:hypothetical protein